MKSCAVLLLFLCLGVFAFSVGAQIIPAPAPVELTYGVRSIIGGMGALLFVVSGVLLVARLASKTPQNLSDRQAVPKRHRPF